MSGGPVEDYLARLRAGLRTPPARTAEIVAEAEDHLRESAAARRAAGLDEEAAQRAAVAAFGPVRQVIRAHRPTVAAYAAATGSLLLPLFGCYLLLAALFGGILTWREIAVFHGVMTPRAVHGGYFFFLVPGRTAAVQLAAVLGGCALAGLAVIAWFLVVRRRRRCGATPAALPRGLFPLAAGIALLGLAVVQDGGERSHGFGWLPHVCGSYELASGGVAAAALLGACCVLRALVTLAEVAVTPREPAVAGLGAMLSGPVLAGEAVLPAQMVPAGETVLADRSGPAEPVPRRPVAAPGTARRAGRCRLARASACAVEAGLLAGQWLGSFLLLSALIAGVLLYVERQGPVFGSRNLPAWEAACAGCGLAGALLFAWVMRARHRRGASQERVTLPRWLTVRVTAAWLAVIAVAEYWIIASNANGRLATAEMSRPAWGGLFWVVIGAQLAAMLIGAGTLGRWVAGRAAGGSASG